MVVIDTRLAAGLDEIGAGFAVFDDNMKLVFCNARYPLIRGYPAALCKLGVELAELFRYNAARGDYGDGDFETHVTERMAQIRRGANLTVDQVLGDGRILAVRYRPLACGGLATTYEDVTEMRRAEIALRHDQTRYELVTQAVSEGLYDWDIVSGQLQVSTRLNALFDFKEGELTSHDWVARLHPDDIASYIASLRDHFTGKTSVLHAEYRIRDKADTYRWVDDHGLSTRNDAGRAIRLVGAVSDITSRKNAERALQESEERYSLAMSAINEGIYDWDVTRDEIFYSPNVMEVVGFTGAELSTPKDGSSVFIPKTFRPTRLPGPLIFVAKREGFSAKSDIDVRTDLPIGRVSMARAFEMLAVGLSAWSGRRAILRLRRHSHTSATKRGPVCPWLSNPSLKVLHCLTPKIGWSCAIASIAGSLRKPRIQKSLPCLCQA